ncbi:DNA adenine methylase [Flavobacteriaceae bacterium Ap0902]|nr:DNA adenine methylase [Flavobacteriaceae bacterium Ap0902]
MSKRKEWKSAPLPFQGQKRFFVKHFKGALKEFPEDANYVDLFGGSGLLSHTVKYVHPTATVVYNDFDNYRKRLLAIPETNRILDELRALNLQTPRGGKIVGKEREMVCNALKQASERGCVDWISLSPSLKFSMNYGVKLEDFINDTMYNNIRKANFQEADDYLAGIEIVSEDYQQLYSRYKDLDNVVFLVDPPYLSTDSSTYKNGDYWSLSDYLDIVHVLDGNYFYFTSNKSHIVELFDWVETRTPGVLPFANATCTVVSNKVTHNASYKDIMYYYKT